jgi:acetyl-CoA acetyltransferase
MRDKAAIAGIGQSAYGRFLPESQLKLGAIALKNALKDAGLQREDIDGMAVHLGWPLGVDYDRAAETYGLDLRWVTQTWLHGRFVTNMIQQAAMAVACGLASVVACFTAISFTRRSPCSAICIYMARQARSSPRCRSPFASTR